MSANNQLLIFHSLGGWEVFDNDVDTQMGNLVGMDRSLKKAIKMANDYMDEHEVEYGLDIKL